MLSAKITVEYTMSSVCNPGDPESCGQTFDEMVKTIIESEGLLGVVDDEHRILSIKQEPPNDPA